MGVGASCGCIRPWGCINPYHGCFVVRAGDGEPHLFADLLPAELTDQASNGVQRSTTVFEAPQLERAIEGRAIRGDSMDGCRCGCRQGVAPGGNAGVVGDDLIQSRLGA